jgi:hypothetical protein
MSLSLPPTTDAIAPRTSAHADVEAKADVEPDYSRNNQLESLQFNGDEEDPDIYPEGGATAWLVVLGAWCAMVSSSTLLLFTTMLMYNLQVPSMGLLNTVGVLQAWVSVHQLHGYSESNIGWIFSAYAFFLYIGGAQVGEHFSPNFSIITTILMYAS